jgi:hypothetical protein
MSNSYQKQEQSSFRSSFNAMYFLANSHATCLTVFLRHSFGSEAIGMNGLVAVLMMLVYRGETRCLAMGTFFMAWLVALIVQRLRTFVLYQRGWRLHSRYGGYPWLAIRIPFVKTEVRAMALEPLVCLLVGHVLCRWSEPVGRFVMFGCFSLAIKNGIERQIDRARLRQMHDAVIEQMHLVERFQQTRKDY